MPRARKQVATDTSALPTETIPYDDAVAEGKEIVAKVEAAERGWLRLGELADQIEPKYKDRTQAKLAAEIGVAKCTLDRYRTVYRSWEGKLAPGPNLSLICGAQGASDASGARANNSRESKHYETRSARQDARP